MGRMGYDSRENDRGSRPPSEDGPVAPYDEVALGVINAFQAENPRTAMAGQLIPSRGDLPRIKIGPLSDPNSACTITLEDSGDRIATIRFKRALISELFSKLVPGMPPVEVEGDGVFYHNSTDQLEGSSTERLTLTGTLSQELDEVVLTHIMPSVDGTMTFKKPAK
jgi:hypothetical protein